MSRAEQGSAARLAAGMRRLLLVAAVLVALAGVQLFVFTERTETHFAWTIDPPLTAAFLGASYWASVVLEWGAARERRGPTPASPCRRCSCPPPSPS